MLTFILIIWLGLNALAFLGLSVVSVIRRGEPVFIGETDDELIWLQALRRGMNSGNSRPV